MTLNILTFGVRAVDANLLLNGYQALNGAIGPNELTSSNLISTSGIPFQQLLLFIGQANNGDLNIDAGEAAFNLSDMGASGSVTSLNLTNTNDALRITAHGLTGASTFGDLTSAVRYDNTLGFGLGNALDRAQSVHWLNGGDSLTFAMSQIAGISQFLATVSFVVNVNGGGSEHVVIAFDGETASNGVDLGAIANGTTVSLDFVARSIRIGATTRAMTEAEYLAFLAGGLNQLTIGSLTGSGLGFAIGGLSIASADAVLSGEIVQAPPTGGETSGTANDDIIVGSAVSDTLNAGAGDDAAFGGGGDDTIDAGEGDDVIEAGDGNDVIIGGSGDDVIIGGVGNDVAAGGAGADRFVFRSLDELSANTDYIIDFEPGIDTIDLAAIGGLVFIGQSAFSGVAGQVRFELVAGTTQIQVDADGDTVLDDRIIINNGRFNFTETALGSLVLQGANANTAPIVALALADQAAFEDVAFSFSVPAGAFTDADGDALTYSAALGNGDSLPAWLSFNAATQTFSGTPGQGDGGVVDVRVTASDGTETVSDVFALVTTVSILGTAGDDVLTGSSLIDDRIFGFAGNDLLYGGGGNDTLNGRLGNDILNGGAGDDALNGDAGADTVVFSGARAEYTISGTTNQISIVDSIAGRDGADIASNVEFIQFADGLFTSEDFSLNHAPSIAPGGDFIVSTAAGRKTDGSVAVLADGRFVLAWESSDASGQDIRARIYNTDGTPVGGDFVVGAQPHLPGDFGVANPHVIGLVDGRFAVTWNSFETAVGSIRLRIFNADGTPVSEDFIVNSRIEGTQGPPAGIGLSDGRLVVTWAADGNIRGRMINADGTPTGDDLFIYDNGAGRAGPPQIASLANGNFVVTWNVNGEIFAKAFVVDEGVPQDGFMVNGVNGAQNGGVIGLADGRFMVVWTSNDGDQRGIYGRVRDVDGTAAGDDFIINGNTVGDQKNPSISALADGLVIVTWESRDVEGDFNIYGRVLSADGTPTGDDFIVNTTTAGDQAQFGGIQGVVGLPDGRVVMTWTDELNPAASAIRAVILNADGAPASETANISISEDTTAVTTVVATDPDGGQTLSFSIVGGDDSSLFMIDASTGVLSFAAAPDFEAPADAGGDNIYNVEVQAEDGLGGIDAQVIAITVGDDFSHNFIGDEFANTLIGSYGNSDTLVGGAGDDTYFAAAGDTIVENAGGGTDTVFVLNGFYTLDANVENIIAGRNGVNVTGNEGNNIITGSPNIDFLDGGGGEDILEGRGGEDRFVFRAGQANGDTVLDFGGNGAAAGDELKFGGYGSALEGATFVQIDATHWQINSADGTIHDVITLANGATVDAGDFIFGD